MNFINTIRWNQRCIRSHKSAPTARPIPARGEAPRTNATKARGLKARPIQISVPQILLVAVHPILLQKRTKLILKRLLALMRFLRIDVMKQLIQIRRANRERTISLLPCKLRQPRGLALEPFGRRRLQIRHQLRNRHSTIQPNGEMNMVRNAANSITFAIPIAGNGGKISMQRTLHNIIKQRQTIFRAEDHMDKNERERSRHRKDYRSGLQPYCFCSERTRGFAPRWHSAAPLALV